MSLCDKCMAPGSCCKQFHLSFTLWMDVDHLEQMTTLGYPFFVPSIKMSEHIDTETNRPYADYLFNCTKLLPNGRCGDYENRPFACRDYEPLEDRLCVHYGGMESGEEVNLIGLT